MEIIDTHCHLDTEPFEKNFRRLIQRAHGVGITTMVMPGITESGWSRLLQLSKTHTGLFAAPGLHPLFLRTHTPSHLEKLAAITKQESLVAIGEIGLDYFVKDMDQNAQQILFEQQLSIADGAKLPVILHVRKAHDQVLATLRKKQFVHGGVVHAFTGSHQQALQYGKLGFMIGFGGPLTYTRARRLRDMATKLPQETIVLESDAPYLSPNRYKGKQNLPEYLLETIKTLAALRQEPLTLTALYTSENARRVLKLPPRDKIFAATTITDVNNNTE